MPRVRELHWNAFCLEMRWNSRDGHAQGKNLNGKMPQIAQKISFWCSAQIVEKFILKVFLCLISHFKILSAQNLFVESFFFKLRFKLNSGN